MKDCRFWSTFLIALLLPELLFASLTFYRGPEADHFLWNITRDDCIPNSLVMYEVENPEDTRVVFTLEQFGWQNIDGKCFRTETMNPDDVFLFSSPNQLGTGGMIVNNFSVMPGGDASLEVVDVKFSVDEKNTSIVTGRYLFKNVAGPRAKYDYFDKYTIHNISMGEYVIQDFSSNYSLDIGIEASFSAPVPEEFDTIHVWYTGASGDLFYQSYPVELYSASECQFDTTWILKEDDYSANSLYQYQIELKNCQEGDVKMTTVDNIDVVFSDNMFLEKKTFYSNQEDVPPFYFKSGDNIALTAEISKIYSTVDIGPHVYPVSLYIPLDEYSFTYGGELTDAELTKLYSSFYKDTELICPGAAGVYPATIKIVDKTPFLKITPFLSDSNYTSPYPQGCVLTGTTSHEQYSPNLYIPPFSVRSPYEYPISEDNFYCTLERYTSHSTISCYVLVEPNEEKNTIIQLKHPELKSHTNYVNNHIQLRVSNSSNTFVSRLQPSGDYQKLQSTQIPSSGTSEIQTCDFTYETNGTVTHFTTFYDSHHKNPTWSVVGNAVTDKDFYIYYELSPGVSEPDEIDIQDSTGFLDCEVDRENRRFHCNCKAPHAVQFNGVLGVRFICRNCVVNKFMKESYSYYVPMHIPINQGIVNNFIISLDGIANNTEYGEPRTISVLYSQDFPIQNTFYVDVYESWRNTTTVYNFTTSKQSGSYVLPVVNNPSQCIYSIRATNTNRTKFSFHSAVYFTYSRIWDSWMVSVIITAIVLFLSSVIACVIFFCVKKFRKRPVLFITK